MSRGNRQAGSVRRNSPAIGAASASARAAKRSFPPLNQLRKRMIIAFLIIVVLFAGLVFRIGYIQVVAAEEYAALAQAGQTVDTTLSAKRGKILDTNMRELALSATNYQVYLRVKPYHDPDYDKAANAAMLDQAAVILAEVLETPKDEFLAKFETAAYRVRVAKDVDKDHMTEILARAKEAKIRELFEPEENSGRVYPLGAFASHVIGSVNGDGHGQSGIEYEYDEYLTGVSGRLVMTTDAAGNPLGNTISQDFEKKDGLSVVLTIDESIQYFVEEALVTAYETTQADSVECIVLEVKTGDVLAMAKYPEYDPNDPRNPIGELEQAAFFERTDAFLKELDRREDFKMLNKQFADGELTQEQYDTSLANIEWSLGVNRMWRNPLISELYEPGSVFKLITVSSAFETNAVKPSDHFYCGGVYKVEDRNIRCWNYPNGHGDQDIVTAVGNSCNPAMMQVIQRMGYTSFSRYLELFGMTEPTGIDLPGEASPLKKDHYYPSDLATMSFGQGLSITPIEMVSGVAAIGNNGNLMRPRLVRALADESGNIVKVFEPEIRRQVISAQTAQEVQGIMEYVVNDGGGQVAKIPGYRIGGKTGTTTKLVDGEYSMTDRIGSMAAMAPMEDPQFVVFVAVDHPRVGEYGTTTAGPAAKSILEQLLNYKNIQPAYTDQQRAALQQDHIVVPKITELPLSEAQAALEAKGLQFSVQRATPGDFEVTDQYPKAGNYIQPGGTVFIYGD